MKVCDTARELFESVNGAVRLSPDRTLTLQDPERFRSELIDTLVLKRNRIRQATITKEISEIVGGAEALK